MKKTTEVRPVSQSSPTDDLDKLMNSEALDEMGLLDLLFVEEILNQREYEKRAGVALQASNF